MWTSTGTSFYCAPEIYMGIGYTYKIDMWAVGVCIILSYLKVIMY